MERTVERLQRTSEATGIDVSDSFPSSAGAIEIPANTKATLLLDNGSLTNAYITLRFSRGRDAAVTLKYAEALFIPADSHSRQSLNCGRTGIPNSTMLNSITKA